MTKKSQNRKQRDIANKKMMQQAQAQKNKIEEFKDNNRGWDDLQRIYYFNQDRLTTMSKHATIFFATPDLPLLLEEQTAKYTCDLIRGFAADLRSFQDRLLSLYNLHKERTGKVDIEEEEGAYTTMVSLLSSYNDFQNDVDLILDPIYQQLLAVAQTIEDKARAALAGMRKEDIAELVQIDEDQSVKTE